MLDCVNLHNYSQQNLPWHNFFVIYRVTSSYSRQDFPQNDPCWIVIFFLDLYLVFFKEWKFCKLEAGTTFRLINTSGNLTTLVLPRPLTASYPAWYVVLVFTFNTGVYINVLHSNNSLRSFIIVLSKTAFVTFGVFGGCLSILLWFRFVVLSWFLPSFWHKVFGFEVLFQCAILLRGSCRLIQFTNLFNYAWMQNFAFV